MRNDIINEIEEKRDWILSTETNNLIQNKNTPQKGILLYSELANTIEEFKHIIREIDREGLEKLPEYRLKNLMDLIKPIFNRIKSIQETDKDPNRPDHEQKNQTIRFFTAEKRHDEGIYNRNKDEIWKIIIEAITLKNKNTLAGPKLDNLISDLETTKENAEGVYRKIEGILKTSQDELAKGGIGKHAKIFQDQANKHSTSAKNWRNNSIVIMIINVIVIIGLYITISFAVTNPTRKIEIGILSVLTISFLSYVIVLCVRNYFAEKHNELINQHKANCLETYNTFIDSAPEDIKSTILLHATQTIFSHQSPGFLSKEILNQSPSPIMEIIRNVTKASENK